MMTPIGLRSALLAVLAIASNSFGEVTKDLGTKKAENKCEAALVENKNSFIKIATDTIENLDSNFNSRFAQTRHGTYEAFEAEIRKSQDPIVQRALRIIDQDQIEVFIRLPESIRLKVAKTGIQNQFETGTSEAKYTPVSRNFYESLLYDFAEPAAYEKLNNKIKPKFGSLGVSLESGLKNWRQYGQYGSDHYILCLPRIRDRLTWAGSDSAALVSRTAPGSRTWQETYIPWSRRLLLVPYMIPDLCNNSFGRPGRVDPTNVRAQQGRSSEFYYEAQILGPIDLQDICGFEYYGSPPSGEFLDALKKHDVKIFDGGLRPK